MPTPNPPASPCYIWQHRAWPQLTFDAAALLPPALDLDRLCRWQSALFPGVHYEVPSSVQLAAGIFITEI